MLTSPGDSTGGQDLQVRKSEPEAAAVRDPVLWGHEGPGGVHHGRKELGPHQEGHREKRRDTGESYFRDKT